METWALTQAVAAGDAGFTAAMLDRQLADVVDSLGGESFAATALGALNAAAAVDFWSVYRVSAERPPRMFLSASRAEHDVSADCFKRYRAGLYRHDRTLTAARDLAGPGTPAMTRWNATEIPSPHRDQIYRRHDICERLSVVAGEADGGLLAINLYRTVGSGAYRDRDVDAVQSLARSLMATVRKQVELIERSEARPESPPANLRERFPELTPRELDVCARLLRGWTYDGIAADLGLSVPSVKTYRARAFERLGIHFRNELFALARGGN